MPTVTITIPESIYERLKADADFRHASIESEIVQCVDYAHSETLAAEEYDYMRRAIHGDPTCNNPAQVAQSPTPPPTDAQVAAMNEWLELENRLTVAPNA
jgi:hypothetical protein